MIALNHVLTGTAIALAVKKPKLAIPLAFASHFVLDAFPHFGGVSFYQIGSPLFPPIIAADGLLSILAVITVAVLDPDLAWVVIGCAAAAILPDILWIFYYWDPSLAKAWFYQFHTFIQWYQRPLGAITEVLYCLLSGSVVAVLVKKRRARGSK